jgi:hypothetical protein
MKQHQNTSTDPKDSLQKLADKWVDAVHSGQEIDLTEIDQFNELLTEAFEYISFYESDWLGFRGLSEFPFNAVSLQDCIYNCEGLEGEDIPYAFRAVIDDYHRIFYFLREVVATDGRSAWILVESQSQGQAGVVERMENVFTTSLAAEIYLRAAGYFFIGETPSGKIDSFTDEQIFELVRKADK